MLNLTLVCGFYAFNEFGDPLHPPDLWRVTGLKGLPIYLKVWHNHAEKM